MLGVHASDVAAPLERGGSRPRLYPTATKVPSFSARSTSRLASAMSALCSS